MLSRVRGTALRMRVTGVRSLRLLKLTHRSQLARGLYALSSVPAFTTASKRALYLAIAFFAKRYTLAKGRPSVICRCKRSSFFWGIVAMAVQKVRTAWRT